MAQKPGLYNNNARMSKEVVFKAKADIEEGSGGQTEGMIRSNALVGVSDKVMASSMLAELDNKQGHILSIAKS